MALAIETYIASVAFFTLLRELRAYRELKNCTRKTVMGREIYECPDVDYYSYKTLNGKLLLYKGSTEDEAAYYHELGHLFFDNFALDPLLASTVIFPIFLLPFPVSMLVLALAFIAVKWFRKLQERRADLFAYEMTGQKYKPVRPERNKLELILHWLFWGHPPENVRTMEEYYKKENSLIKLFIKSVFS